MTAVTVTSYLTAPEGGWTARRAAQDRSLPDRRPFLVVEILSPSTRATDRTLKRHVFEQGGVPSFWLVDPLTPSVTVLELRDGVYAEIAVISADERHDAALPFPVSFVPSELVL